MSIVLDKNVGEIIKSIRRSRGLTQKELAKLIGISNTYLSDLEVNRVNPSLSTLLRILDKLDVGIEIIDL